MKYYTGNNTGDVPGNLPSPYYWWEAGAFFGLMVEYTYYTGDTTYNTEVFQAIQHQVGTDDDFMPSNQTKAEVITSRREVRSCSLFELRFSESAELYLSRKYT